MDERIPKFFISNSDSLTMDILVIEHNKIQFKNFLNHIGLPFDLFLRVTGTVRIEYFLEYSEALMKMSCYKYDSELIQ